MQNLMEVGRSVAELLRIFVFPNGGRPPSWIWYDVIADHPRLSFDGPNVLLKLHIDRIYTLRDIAIYIIWSVWIEIAYSRLFWGSFGIYYLQIYSDIVATPKRPSLAENTWHEIKLCNPSTVSTWARAQDKNAV